MERRNFARIPLRLSCQATFSSGVTIYGNTRDISSDGVSFESGSMPTGGSSTLATGENGILTLSFRKGAAVDSILVNCQVRHVMGSIIGLAVRFSELNKKEQGYLAQMIKTRSAVVDSR